MNYYTIGNSIIRNVRMYINIPIDYSDITINVSMYNQYFLLDSARSNDVLFLWLY